MATHTLRSIDEMGALHHGVVKLAAAELGIESFGMQVLDFPAGFDGYPEHDHADERMEEVYAVLDGSAEFEIDGERVPLDGSRILRVDPAARRKLHPGPDRVRLRAIGCTIGGAYERPESLRLDAAGR